MSSTPDPAHDRRPALDRRTMLRGVAATGALGASAGILAGCGGDSGSASSQEGSGSASGSGGSANKELGSAAGIPVGGGMVFNEQQVVVTQPSKGDFRAFSAICTHQGCPVDEVADGTINCPCHGSKYKIEDGSVVDGPAPSPLPRRRIRVSGGDIRLA